MPGSVWETSHVELGHLSVPLEVEVLRLADVAHVVPELHRIAIPEEGEAGVGWRWWGIEAGGPHTPVQAVVRAPGLVPVAGHVPLLVQRVRLRVVEAPGQTAPVQYKCTTVLYFTLLYCTILYCTVLYCTILYYTVLYCTVLYCTVTCTEGGIRRT